MKAKKNKSNKSGKMPKVKNKEFKPGKKKGDVSRKIKKHQKNQKPQRVPPKGSYKYSAKKLLGLTLRERMLDKLKTSRFRFINEQLYTMKGQEALRYFKEDKEAFSAYHEGYKQQVEQWPINPVDVIIQSLRSLNKDVVIADFGCGDAKIAKVFPKKTVHSFDLVSLDPCVTVCDMAKTPLPDSSVDVAVFCLSLMGTNFADFVVEANRVLKIGGLMKIAEVESRFESIDVFVKSMSKYGFTHSSTNRTHELFCFMDFKKNRSLTKTSMKKLVPLTLNPCLYKKR